LIGPYFLNFLQPADIPHLVKAVVISVTTAVPAMTPTALIASISRAGNAKVVIVPCFDSFA